MKRDRLAEAEKNLQNIELRLKDLLLALLPDVAVSGASLFTNSFHNPHGLSVEKIWAQAESLYQEANMCVEARSTLGLPIENSVGYLFISACEELASSNEQRREPRKLATSLLESLRS